MKKVLVISLLSFLAIAGTAQAFHYRMSYGQARAEAKRISQHLCEEERECTGWGVGGCYRQSDSRFDCAIAGFSPGAYVGEEIECNTILHLGVDRSGIIRLKNFGEPHCFSRP